MRMIKSLAVAAMLVAVVAAAPTSTEASVSMNKATGASREVVAAVGKSLDDIATVPKHMHKLRKQTHALHRAFSAKQETQTASCDQAGFADATARVLQACPSLSGLVSGATSLEEFLPGFCGSECYTALSEELVRHAGCVDETTAFLLEFVYTCQTRPQCFSEGFIVGGSRLAARCDAQINALFDISNFTTAAYADARAACSGTCATEQATLLETYGVCLGPNVNGAATSAALSYMCSTPAGAAAGAEPCGVQLKGFGEMQCDSVRACSTSSKCRVTSTSCEPIMTTANLNGACSDCLTGFLPHLSAFGQDPALMALGVEMYCQKLTPGAAASDANPYCFPVAMTALTSAATAGSAATACAATGAGECTDRVLGLAADFAGITADVTFKACLNVTGSVSSCLTAYETALREAAQTSVYGRLACAQNAANAYCYDNMVAWMAAAGGCSGCTCSVDTAALLQTSGCCTPLVNDALQVSLDFPASYLPAGTRTVRVNRGMVRGETTFTYTHTARYSQSQLTRADLAFHGVVACNGNTSALWSIVESPCPTTLAAPPAAEFPVSLAWERVSANPTLKADLESSLRADTARNLGVKSKQIVNGTLARGTGEVQLRTTASASAGASAASRRQTTATSTGANCAYQFQVDAATEADATAKIAELQQLQSNGSFVTPTTSRTATSKCTECMDSRQNSLVNAAAPAPGAAPPSGGAVSPATGVAAAVAGVAAAVLAVLAL